MTMEAEKFLTCDICAHHCRLKDGATGLCRVHQRRGDKIVSLVFGRIVAENIDPVEKKPLFHYLPGSLTYSIATCGCNFRCLHCQNSSISQVGKDVDVETTGVYRAPEQIVAGALAGSCRSISYTYVEPTIFFEYAFVCSVAAKEAGLGNIFVSNGYLSQKSSEKISPYLSAANIDLKSFSDTFYRDVCGARLQPVLDTIRLLHEAGVWLEITTLLIPGYNDSDGELRQIAEFIYDVDANMPWHVTGFYPTYKLTNAPPTSVDTLVRARQIGLDTGVRYVYTGNRPGVIGENTYCPQCGTVVISRSGFRVTGSSLAAGTCAGCGAKIAGVW